MDMKQGTLNISLMQGQFAGKLQGKEQHIIVLIGTTGGQMGQGWHRTSRQMYIFLLKSGMSIMNPTGFLVHKRIVLNNRVEFVSSRMSCTVVRGHWCEMNIDAQIGDKTNDIKGRFHDRMCI
jgi:hypothetical protein